jgi:chromosomal replication initiator protein
MDAWERFVLAQEAHLGKETTDRWLRTLKVVDFDACNLYLEAANAFQISWFEEHIRKIAQKELLNNNHRQIKVHLTLSVEETLKTRSKKGTNKSHVSPAPFPFQFSKDALEEWATLEQFVPSCENLLLTRFLDSLLHSESYSAYNPLFLYGGSGVGKTHLLMALTRSLRAKNKNALYVRAETFTEHVVNAIRSGEMQAFRKAYRHADILLVDNVHLFARKNATQEEFFHTFNALHTTGRQIILASPLPPPDLEEIEARLISRFEWGLVLRLEKLSPQELQKVLTQRCAALHFPLQDSVSSFLLEHFGQNQKSLLQALDTLILREHLSSTKPPLDVKVAREYLTTLLEAKEKEALSPDKILTAVATFYGIRKEDILGKGQTQECSVPRQISMYLCRHLLKIPFMAIGRIFSRDHSTVMTSVKQIQKSLDEQDPEIKDSLVQLNKSFCHLG